MRGVRKFLKKILLVVFPSNTAYCGILTITARILGARPKFSWLARESLYRISDPDGSCLVGRKERLHLYRRGVASRINFVFGAYHVPRAVIREGDIVVDCGANIGEFSLAVERSGAIVHAFEPDHLEFSCLKRNLGSGSHAYNMALWRTTSKLNFDSRNESGDSRVTGELDMASGHKHVEGVSLDDWAIEHLGSRDRIRLLKVEAEGGELEVMEGASEALKRTDYVVADLGERGIDGEYPLAGVTNYLCQKGFEFLKYTNERGVALYRTTKLGSNLDSR